MNSRAITAWAETYSLKPIDIDCTTAVMLKILDGKCKMSTNEKVVMSVLYDAIKHKPGELLGAKIHQLIATARGSIDDNLLEQVYEQRLYAEQMISRPVMKAYKAMLRQERILLP